MLKSLILTVFLLFASLPAGAANYTDVYYNPAEQGWGVFLVQSDTTQFLAFFIYGPDGKPTWYTAQLADNGSGTYTGDLYATTGTYFPNPWQGVTLATAGTASFAPTDNYHATLTYTVNGAGTVTKSIQRQTLAPYLMSGNYSGSMAGSISGCIDPADNDASLRARYGLVVEQVGDTSATLTFAFVNPELDDIVCKLSGPITHLGRLYQLNGQSVCGPSTVSPQPPYPAVIDSLHPTGQGIEGRWTGSLADGCKVSAHFSAVKAVNN